MKLETRDSIFVTGATGKTGKRVVDGLLLAGQTVLAASRHPDPTQGATGVEFDWNDQAAAVTAVSTGDIRALYLVPPVREPDPAVLMLPVLEAARDAGVGRVVLLSAKPVAMGAPGVGIVHAKLPELFPEWVVLRPTWFMQDFLGEHYLARMLQKDGTLLTASGDGRLAFIDADDIAKVATVALISPEPLNRDLILTGPESLSYADVAAVLQRVTGLDVHVHELSEDQLAAELARTMPAALAAILAAADRSLGEGASDVVSNAVKLVTGHDPASFEAFALSAWKAGALRISNESK